MYTRQYLFREYRCRKKMRRREQCLGQVEGGLQRCGALLHRGLPRIHPVRDGIKQLACTHVQGYMSEYVHA